MDKANSVGQTKAPIMETFTKITFMVLENTNGLTAEFTMGSG